MPRGNSRMLSRYSQRLNSKARSHTIPHRFQVLPRPLSYSRSPSIDLWVWGLPKDTVLQAHCSHYLSWMQSTTSSITSSKSKVPQVNPMTRLAHDPEKQGTHAKPSDDLVSCDQTRNRSPDLSRALTHDKSQDSICFGWARSPLINKWQTVGTVCNQWRHVTPVIE